MTEIVKAFVENGVVVKAFLLLPEKVPPHLEDWITAPVQVGEGWQFDGTTFTPPTEEYLWNKLLPARQTMTLSFAQLLIGLVNEGWITEAEGDNWADGILPQRVVDLIATLPPEQQFSARTRAKRPSEISRVDPLVIMLGMSEGKTSEEMDEFFAAYRNI